MPTDRDTLTKHLLDSGLAGDTATPRSNVVAHAKALSEDDPDKALGLGRRGRDAQGVIDAVAKLCGCSNDLGEVEGPGYIDPERTLDGLDAMAQRIATAAKNKESVLLATGHPTALTPWYSRIADHLSANGCKVLTPIEDVRLDAPEGSRHSRSPRIWRFFDGVGCFCVGWALVHTHESWPMAALLDACDPDLVISDHGFAGVAAARGVDCCAVTDVNDPAISVGYEDGLFASAVPLDDNLPPRLYVPLAEACL